MRWDLKHVPVTTLMNNNNFWRCFGWLRISTEISNWSFYIEKTLGVMLDFPLVSTVEIKYFLKQLLLLYWLRNQYSLLFISNICSKCEQGFYFGNPWCQNKSHHSFLFFSFLFLHSLTSGGTCNRTVIVLCRRSKSLFNSSHSTLSVSESRFLPSLIFLFYLSCFRCLFSSLFLSQPSGL